MIHHGDCIEVMAGMDPESVDAIVTDPPYGLEFMGKEWDRLDRHGAMSFEQTEKVQAPYVNRTTGASKGESPYGNRPRWSVVGADGWRAMQRWHQQWAEAAYRVAKPSAYLLAFGGTRTVHRMTVALEDAGWIIRDMLVWGYASGFPKSKASLKPAWEPIVMARKPGPLRDLAIDACRIPSEPHDAGRDGEATASTRYTENGGTNLAALPGPRGGDPSGRWPANIVLTDPIFDGGIEGVVGGGETTTGALRPYTERHESATSYSMRRDKTYIKDQDSGTYSRFFLVPKSSRSDREPIDPSYSYRLHRERGECAKLSAWDNEDQNLAERMDSTSLGRGTSEAMSTDDRPLDMSRPGSQPTDPSQTAIRSTTSTATNRTIDSTTSSSLTPSPTNVSTPVASSEMGSGGNPVSPAGSSNGSANPTGISPLRAGPVTDGAGPVTSPRSSSRNACVVCGKPLPRFSTHPTQKPTALMQHLVRLVTPTGGLVLDPFLGSGTTGLAAEREGFRWIGIEREAEYVAIAEARLNGTQRGLGLEAI